MHPADSDLRSLIDGEIAAGAADHLQAHLDACPRCAERRATIEEAVGATGALLASLDRPAPEISVEDVIQRAEGRRIHPARAPRRSLLAASVAALVATGVVAAAVLPGSPLRGLLERIGSEPEAQRPAETATEAGIWSQRTGVAIVPAAGLEIVFETDQDEGSIELATSVDDTVRVEVRSDSVGFRVGGRSILVENRAARASYRITLPGDLPAARIRVGDRAIYERSGDEVLESAFGGPREGQVRFPLSGRPDGT